MYSAAVLLFCVFVSAATAVENLQLKNELKDSPEERVEMMMSEIKSHCDVVSHPKSGSRQKRQSEAGMNSYLRRALQECLNPGSDDMNPTSAPVPFGPSIHGPCTSPTTVNLTQSWRKDNKGSHFRPAGGFYACDRELQRGTIWFRFTGAAGTQLSNRCAPAYSCGGHGGFWSNAQMPTRVGEIRRVPIYGSWNGNCNWYTWPTANSMFVQRCSDRSGDFVYKVHGTSSCYWTFCGMDIAS